MTLLQRLWEWLFQFVFSLRMSDCSQSRLELMHLLIHSFTVPNTSLTVMSWNLKVFSAFLLRHFSRWVGQAWFDGLRSLKAEIIQESEAQMNRGGRSRSPGRLFLITPSKISERLHMFGDKWKARFEQVALELSIPSTVLKLLLLHKTCTAQLVLQSWSLSLAFTHQLSTKAICKRNGCWRIPTVRREPQLDAKQPGSSVPTFRL